VQPTAMLVGFFVVKDNGRSELRMNKPYALVVEDNKVNAILVNKLLERQGWTVVNAYDGQMAIDLFKRYDFQLICMDIQLPVLDGYEATKQIRQLEQITGKNATIIALTAYAMKGDREKCIAVGMDDYISKPIDIKKFVEKITIYNRRNINEENCSC